MRGRISVLLAGAALAVGGGVAGAVVVAPKLADSGPSSVEVRQAAEKQAYATLRHTFHVAKKARGMARGARQFANGLSDLIDEARASADAANSRVDSTRVVSNTAADTATAPSGNTDYHAAPDGPRVTVTVPPSGLIEVWATVTVESDEGAVALFRDGNVVPIPGQDGVCDLDNALLMSQVGGGPLTISTPPTVPGFGGICGTIGDAPAPVLFNQPPGEHTYELRYADCGCSPGDDAIFSNRTLRVGPRL